MISVLIWFGVLQVLKAIFAGICALRMHFSIQASHKKEHQRGRQLLKAIALLCISGVLTALFWELVYFGENVFPFRMYQHYRWGLFVLIVIAEAPFFAGLFVLWNLMDSIPTEGGR